MHIHRTLATCLTCCLLTPLPAAADHDEQVWLLDTAFALNGAKRITLRPLEGLVIWPRCIMGCGDGMSQDDCVDLARALCSDPEYAGCPGVTVIGNGISDSYSVPCPLEGAE